MNTEKVKKLYNDLVGLGVNGLGDEQMFLNKMNNRAERENLYSYLISNGATQIGGDIDEFDARLGFQPTTINPDAQFATNPWEMTKKALKGNRSTREDAPSVEDVEPMPKRVDFQKGMADTIIKQAVGTTGVDDFTQAWNERNAVGQMATRNPILNGSESIFKNIEQGNIGKDEYAFLNGQRKQAVDRVDAILSEAKRLVAENPDKYYTIVKMQMTGGGGLQEQMMPTNDGLVLFSVIDKLEETKRHYERAVSKADKNIGKADNALKASLGEVDLINVLTAGWKDTLRDLNLAGIATKENRGEMLTPEENLYLKLFQEESNLEDILNMEGGTTGWYNVGKGIADSTPYLTGMGMTSGIAAPIKAGAEGLVKTTANRGLKQFLQKGTSKLLGSVAAAAATTPLQAGMWDNYAKNTINEWMEYGGIHSSKANRLRKGFADAFTDVFTEHLGGILTQSAKYAFPKLGVEAVLARNSVGSGFVKDMLKRIEWTGPLGEFEEELWAGILSPIIRGASKGERQQEYKEFFNKENLWTTLMTTALMGAGFKAMQAPEAGIQIAKYSNARRKANNNLKNIRDLDLRQQVYDALQLPTMKETAEALSHIEWRKYDQSDIGFATDYVYNNMQKGVMDGAYIAEEANKALAVERASLNAVQRNGVVQTANVDGQPVYLLGDVMPDSPNAPIVIVRMDGTREQVPMSAVKDVAQTSVDDVIATLFADKVAEVQQQEAVDSKAQDIEDAREAGVTPAEDTQADELVEGDIVVVNGEEGEIIALDPNAGKARVMVGNKSVEVAISDLQPATSESASVVAPPTEQTTPPAEQPTEDTNTNDAPAAPQKTEPIRDKDGKVDFNAMGEEQSATFISETMKDRGLGWVEEQITTRQRTLEKEQKRTALPLDFDEAQKAIANQQANIERLQQEIAMWEGVKARLTAPTTEEVTPDATVEETATPTYKLSDEIDENGRQFVETSDGSIEFGFVESESGLTPAPILLSEGMITNSKTNDGYGLVHIEARHGDQIRKAGYKSVVDFIEAVAKGYTTIREGKKRDGQQTYLLQLTDTHNNTLMVELSSDGNYWNINTAGIFKISYGKNGKVVYNRYTTAKQTAESVEVSQESEQSGSTETPSINTPASPSDNKDTTSVPENNAEEQKNVTEEKENAPETPTTYEWSAGLVRNDFAKRTELADVWDKIAKALDVRLELTDDIEEDGEYDAATKTIKVAYTNRSKGLAFIVGHEFLHRMKDISSEMYEQFKQSVIDYYGKEAFDEKFKQMEAVYEGAIVAGRVKAMPSDATLEEEVVADLSGALISRFDVFEQFVERHKDDNAFLRTLRSVMQHIRNFFKGLKHPLKAETKKCINLLNELIEASAKAMRDGVPNVIESADGKVQGVTDTQRGQGKFSLRTYEEGGRVALESFLDERVKDKALTTTEAQEMLSQMDDIYNLCNTLKDNYAPFGVWSEAKVVVDDNGDPVFSVIKQNGEYVMNLDFSLVCKKRRTLDAVLNEMVRRGMIESVSTDNTTIAKINEVIRKYGFETACALCFVDARRFQVLNTAKNFTDLWNEVVKSVVPKGAEIGYFDFIRNENGVAAEVNEEKLRKMSEGRTVRARIAKYLLQNPQEARLLRPRDFVSTIGFDNVKAKYPAIMSLYNSKKGTGGPKAAFSDVQYLNDILNTNWNEEDAFAIGGVRLQSFSDYVPRMVFDYIQMIADLAAKGLPVHAYTKEMLFAKTFGLTGMKINLSLVPDVVEGGVAAGLDANGNYVWKEGETFPYEEAIAIQNAEGYKKNCGTIAVGVSDAHIEKLLGDDNIRMVIPYHKSGLPKAVAQMNNVAGFTDYTNAGHETHKSGKALSAAEKKEIPNFNELLREHNDPKKAAQAFLDWCESKGYTPRFAKFASHPNYYKLLEDFTTLVEGEYMPQEAVKFNFPTEGDAFGSLASLIEQGLEEDAILEGQRDDKVGAIVEEVGEVLGTPRYSLRALDAPYLDAVEKGDMDTAQRMVMEAAKIAMPNTKVVDENGNPKVVYHQTNASVYINRETGQNWDELDWRERMEWDERDDWDDYWEEREFNTFSRVNARTTNEFDGFFFAPEYDEYHEYGDRTIKAFLNIENPAFNGDYNIDSSKNNAGRDERIRLQNEGFDGVIREYDGVVDEYIAFEPNQIKSADPVTYDDNGNVIPLSERFNPRKADIRYSISTSANEFNNVLNTALANVGIVIPNISNKEVNIVRYEDEKEPPIKAKKEEIIKWAKENVVTPDSFVVDSKGIKHKCPITTNVIREMLNDNAINASVSKKAHLLVLPLLKKVLANSIEVEIHPDYNKIGTERKPENGHNPNLLIHRFYGAVEIEGEVYRTKTIVKEYRDKNTNLSPYTYEVTKIELLPTTTADAENAHSRQASEESNSISATKLLTNVEKSYDKGKKVLEESKKFLFPLRQPTAEEMADIKAEREAIEREAKANGTWLKAPNGQSSNLTPEQWVNVRTSRFKEWFGDWENDPENASKVVDANGEPMVVYHGTPNIFTAFDKNKRGSSTDRGIWGNGFYFSESSDYADTYAKRNGVEGRTMVLFLNVKRPLFVSLKSGGNEGAMYFTTLYSKYFTDEVFEDIYKVEENMARAQEGLSNEMINDGYDGIIVEYSHPTIADEYVVFEPNQIKSATDNVGTFDANTPDIRHSLRLPEYQERFSQLTEEYNALDKNDAKSLADFRARKRTLVEEYWNDFARALGANVETMVIDSTNNTEALRPIYNIIRETSGHGTSFEEFVDDYNSQEDGSAFHIPNTHIIVVDMAKIDNLNTQKEISQIFLHENVHRIIEKNVSQRDLVRIWRECAGKDFGKLLRKGYPEDGSATLGNEMLAYSIAGLKKTDITPLFDFIEGANNIPVEEVMAMYKKTLPLRNEIASKILTIIKDEYNKERELNDTMDEETLSGLWGEYVGDYGGRIYGRRRDGYERNSSAKYQHTEQDGYELFGDIDGAETASYARQSLRTDRVGGVNGEMAEDSIELGGAERGEGEPNADTRGMGSNLESPRSEGEEGGERGVLPSESGLAESVREGEVTPDFDESPRYSLRDLEDELTYHNLSAMNKTSRKILKVIQDNMVDINHLQEALKKAGVPISDLNDFYNAIDTANAKAQYRYDKYFEEYVEPLLDLMSGWEQSLGLTYDDICDYLLAKHSIERHDSGLNALNPDDDAVWGRKNVEKIVADFESKVPADGVEKLWELIGAINNRNLDILLQGGIKTPADIQMAKSHNWKYYVPLKEWAWEDEGFVDPSEYYDTMVGRRNGKIAGKWIEKAAKGRTSKPANPLPHMFMAGSKAFSFVERNKAMVALYNLLLDANEKLGDEVKGAWTISERFYVRAANGVWEEKSAEEIPANEFDAYKAEMVEIAKLSREMRKAYANARKLEKVGNMQDALLERMRGDNINAEIKNRKANLNITIENPQAYHPNERMAFGKREFDKNREVGFYVNGQYITIEFTNSRYPAAINKVSEVKMRSDNPFFNNIIKGMRWATRFKSQTSTTYNPAFMLINFLKDAGFATYVHLVDKEHGNLLGYIGALGTRSGAINRGLKGTARPLSKEEMGDLNLSNKGDRAVLTDKYGERRVNDTLFKWFLENGAPMGFSYMKDTKNIEKELRKKLRRMRGKYNTAQQFQNVLPELLQWAERMSQNVELSNRFATFVASLDKGESVGQAVSNSRNFTLNFNKKGDVTGVFSTIYAFFNPYVQGLAQFVKVSAKNWQRSVPTLAAIATLGYLMNMWVESLWGDDDGDDDKQTTTKVADWLKRGYLVIPMSQKDGSVIRIPLPQQIRTFFAFGSALYDYQSGKLDGKGLRTDLANSFLNDFTYGFTEGGGLLRAISPSAFQPIVDLWRNKDAWGREIYRESEVYPKSEMGKRNTSKWAKDVTRALNTLTGGNKYKSGKIDINPDVMQYLVEQSLGGAGTFGRRTIEFFESLPKDSQVEFELQNIPMFGSLMYSVNPDSGYEDYSKYQQRFSNEASGFEKKKYKDGYISREEYEKYLAQKKTFTKLKNNLVKPYSDVLNDLKYNTDAYDSVNYELRRMRNLINRVMSEMDWDNLKTEEATSDVMSIIDKYSPDYKERLNQLFTEYAKEK